VCRRLKRDHTRGVGAKAETKTVHNEADDCGILTQNIHSVSLDVRCSAAKQYELCRPYCERLTRTSLTRTELDPYK